MKIRETRVFRGQKNGGGRWEAVVILSDFLYNGVMEKNDE
jgi:hypothetical protein